METTQQPLGKLVIRTVAMPKDANVDGDIFGGYILSQMDIGGAIVAKERAQKRIVSVAVERMTFIHPVKIGDVISCYGHVQKVGNTSITISVEIWVTQHCFEVGTKVTEGLFTYVALDNNGKPTPVNA